METPGVGAAECCVVTVMETMTRQTQFRVHMAPIISLFSRRLTSAIMRALLARGQVMKVLRIICALGAMTTSSMQARETLIMSRGLAGQKEPITMFGTKDIKGQDAKPVIQLFRMVGIGRVS